MTLVWSSSERYGLMGRLKHWFATFSATGKSPSYVQDFRRLVEGVKEQSNRKPKGYLFLSGFVGFLLFVQKGLCIEHKPRCCVLRSLDG